MDWHGKANLTEYFVQAMCNERVAQSLSTLHFVYRVLASVLRSLGLI